MKKKAEEIKRKMAEAAGDGDGDALDKTVMMPKKPTSQDDDSTG